MDPRFWCRFISRQFHQRSLLLLLGLLVGVAIALTPLLPIQANFSQTTSSELRGVWLTNIDSEVLFSRHRLDRALHRVGLISEIVRGYDIDGLQLDDHFGIPVEMGYDPLTVQLYQTSHNGNPPPTNPKDPEWMRWRANQITRLMTQVFQAIKAQKQDCVVVLSPNNRDFAYQNFLQDWGNWERSGYVEELILQVYRRNVESFVQELDRPEVQQARSHIPVSVGILTGLVEEPPIDTRLIEQKVRTVRDRQFAGVSFFFYETLNGRDNALRNMFRQPAQRPILPHLRMHSDSHSG